jgi:hypothetical protein
MGGQLNMRDLTHQKKEDDDEPNHGIFGVSPKFPDETSHEGMEGADSEHLRQVFDHSAAPDGFAASRMTCREEAITLSTRATSDILQTLLTPCSAEKISNMACPKKGYLKLGYPMVSYSILHFRRQYHKH